MNLLLQLLCQHGKQCGQGCLVSAHWCHHPRKAVLRQNGIAQALLCAALPCSCIGEDGSHSSWAAGACIQNTQNTPISSKKILTMYIKIQQEQFQCVSHQHPLLNLTPVGFTPSCGTTTRVADSPPPRLQRPFLNCFSPSFGPLSLGEAVGCSASRASVPSVFGGFAPRLTVP